MWVFITELEPEEPMQLMKDRILVLPDEIREDITTAGIFVNVKTDIESQKQLGKTGTVIEVGPDVDQDQLKPGDRIIFGEFMHPKYETKGKRYLVLQDKDVVGVIE